MEAQGSIDCELMALENFIQTNPGGSQAFMKMKLTFG